MKYCSECGGKVSKRIPDGDNVIRYICDQCQKIHYQNPTIIAGCLAEWQGKILLCRRAIEPRIGTWTLPAGFMENGESVEAAAQREAREETGADIDVDALYSVFDVAQINQVYIVYRGKMQSPAYESGEECLEVRLFDPADIPWDNIFYPAISDILRRYVSELEGQQFGIYMGSSVTGKVALIDKERPC